LWHSERVPAVSEVAEPHRTEGTYTPISFTEKSFVGLGMFPCELLSKERDGVWSRHCFRSQPHRSEMTVRLSRTPSWNIRPLLGGQPRLRHNDDPALAALAFYPLCCEQHRLCSWWWGLSIIHVDTSVVQRGSLYEQAKNGFRDGHDPQILLSWSIPKTINLELSKDFFIGLKFLL